MPVGLDSLGLPIGLQVMAGPLRDDLLFGAGLAIEKALGTLRERLAR
jgi:aspartyl-tRNA(Asn)/glutamyl-tRNA(Gln) amidotransferase subunit A